MALRRVQALQQRGPSAASEAVQNSPAGSAGDEKGGVAYTDQDQKVLQLCGEDLARRVLGAGSTPGGRVLYEGRSLGGGERPGRVRDAIGSRRRRQVERWRLVEGLRARSL